MHFQFITSTPLNIERGSGTFAGIATLAKFLQAARHRVDLVTPQFHLPIYTAERLLFNQSLRFLHPFRGDATVGFDMDGYTLRGNPGLHVAAIKGVIADEMRFESGLTRATMRLQAHCEKKHVERADLIIATSRYSAENIQQFYGISRTPRIVPEPIDLNSWKKLLARNSVPPSPDRFTVLSVCRFYPRKRLPLLLAAADRLRPKIPGLEVRIVGGGPEAANLRSLWQQRNLPNTVTWLGDLSQDELAREYNRCHVFCLPSVQEAFGIVFLEAMAAGKPIVAARAAAVPEVVQHGMLAEPDDEQSLADAIERLYNDAVLRQQLAAAASQFVSQFDAPRVAAKFIEEIASVKSNRQTEASN
jgi:glycosyltransferase involved in cell wall biosynthesis